ncbi:FMN-binding negative transcriptional regulator [Flavihumibacter cheonanensis]|uniref:FMN-binding negative transcriptional regulator n=1 Tax=Flavihumibacter cheonanensis TaxID=1442385 RepID=UPI001EF95B73|nr:FMN-binding negative transcriptional regulator [Flavihumibacter cheonanensis]MCG7754017.1 FMN-binding negative transcriptional regulator [Flavihumibacter cheonanensis]
MYVPAAFRFEDVTDMISFMKQYSFATIITVKEGLPIATHLPFQIQEQKGGLVLRSHFAANNEQAGIIESTNSLVIFTEPHAYISPAQYDKLESVPTWNYLAVHAYGKANIVRDEKLVQSMLEEMIQEFEPAYLEQWNGLTDKFRKGMMKGLVAFEIPVTDLQGKKKLSQNKTAAERDRIISRLESEGDAAAKQLAQHMRMG